MPAVTGHGLGSPPPHPRGGPDGESRRDRIPAEPPRDPGRVPTTRPVEHTRGTATRSPFPRRPSAPGPAAPTSRGTRGRPREAGRSGGAHFHAFPHRSVNNAALFAQGRKGLHACGPGTLTPESARAVRLRRTGKSDAAIGSWMWMNALSSGKVSGTGGFGRRCGDVRPVGLRSAVRTGATVLPGAVNPCGADMRKSWVGVNRPCLTAL